MPLPPLPENNTDRLWLKYTSGAIEHEIVFRFTSATTQADQVTAATAFANVAKGVMHTADSFLSVRHQDAGSTLSFPLAFTAIAGTSTTVSESNDKPMYMALSGRSLDGYRCKLTFFTGTISDALGYRQNRGASAVADAIYTAVVAMTTQPVSISGSAVIWNGYTNLGYNAYWQRKQRI